VKPEEIDQLGERLDAGDEEEERLIPPEAAPRRGGKAEDRAEGDRAQEKPAR
jgi:hypothetical protein